MKLQILKLLIAALCLWGAQIQAANVTITTSVNKGIASITYGTDPHNYVSQYSGAPVFRAQKGTDTGKVYEPLGPPVLSTTNTPNDTITMSSPNVVLTVITVAGADGYGFNVKVLNNYPTDIVEWDLKLYTHAFEGLPTYDGTVSLSNGQNGYDINDALRFVFDDNTQVSNPWQCWFSSLIPISMHFSPKNYPQAWEVWFNADTNQPGIYCVTQIPAGKSLNFDTQMKFSATQPDPTLTAPTAFSLQKARWPMMVRQDLYPAHSIIGADWLASSPGAGAPPYPNNLNRWNNDPNLMLYDANGQLLAKSGDYSGLKKLASFMIGRIHWCNSRTKAAGGIGVIHWDLYDGQRYAQPGLSYKGDPRVSQVECPELWYSDANYPISVIRQVEEELDSDGTTHMYGWLTGIGLRASVWTGPPIGPNQRTYRTLDEGVQNLLDKIEIAYWAGHRLFYLDSFGPYNTPPQAYAVELIRQVMAVYPDILLIPESYGRDDMYSAGCPWKNTASSSPVVRQIWGTAYAMTRMQNSGTIDMRPGHPNYPATVALMHKMYTAGDCIIANSYSGTPTEVEQAGTIEAGIKNGTL
jgi:hypothetical protein